MKKYIYLLVLLVFSFSFCWASESILKYSIKFDNGTLEWGFLLPPPNNFVISQDGVEVGSGTSVSKGDGFSQEEPYPYLEWTLNWKDKPSPGAIQDTTWNSGIYNDSFSTSWKNAQIKGGLHPLQFTFQLTGDDITGLTFYTPGDDPKIVAVAEGDLENFAWKLEIFNDQIVCEEAYIYTILGLGCDCGFSFQKWNRQWRFEK